MSYLLSTTYPSGQGLVAAAYACGLASDLDCPIRLLHAYTVPVTFGEMPLPVMPADDMRELATDEMNAAVAKLRMRFPGTDITSDIAYGNLVDILNDKAEHDPPLLTIIGNDEEADADGWIGNGAAELLREAGHPVLAIPKAAIYHKPAHVCITCDGRSVSAGISTAVLLRLQEACNFHITVLHIRTEEEPSIVFPGSTLDKQLSKSGAAYVELTASGGVDNAIAQYAASEGIDWLAVVPHHYGFWKGLFHKSHTTHILHLAHVPILALH